MQVLLQCHLDARHVAKGVRSETHSHITPPLYIVATQIYQLYVNPGPAVPLLVTLLMPAGLVFGQHKRHLYNYIMYSRALSSLYVGLGFAIGSSALDTNSTWAIYSDSACQQSVDTIVGQDGFPDGVCTNIPNTAANYGDYKGFEFIHLDSGCARKSTSFS